MISHVVSMRAEEPTAAVEGATPAAEPEVIKKGKKEDADAAAKPEAKKPEAKKK